MQPYSPKKFDWSCRCYGCRLIRNRKDRRMIKRVVRRQAREDIYDQLMEVNVMPVLR